MDKKIRCQSCGMPLQDGYFGSNVDGSKNVEYCQFCFQNGEFTKPQQTLTEMIQSSIHFMTTKLDFTYENASELSNKIIPQLKRWRTLVE